MLFRLVLSVTLFLMLSAMSGVPSHNVHESKAYGDYFKHYLSLDTIPRSDLEGVYWNALFAGRYDYLVRLNGRSSWQRYKKCAHEDQQSIYNPLSRLIAEAANHKVLAFNESHTQLQQRFFLLQNLEAFWNAGYRHLGYEALWANDLDLDDQSAEHAGFYFHEPVMAATLRKALSIGFGVFGYENDVPIAYDADWAQSINHREAGQARRVADYISKISDGDKVLIWAGGHHITKNNDQSLDDRNLVWMAARLVRDYKIDVYSVDLTSCQFQASRETEGARGYQTGDGAWFINEHFNRWGIDAQLQLPLVYKSKVSPNLYRKHIGKEIFIPEVIRALSPTIFVQAFRVTQNENATAFDSILMTDDEDLPLYLPEGDFKLVIYDADGKRMGETLISVN